MRGGTWSNLLDLSTLTGAAGQDGADGQDGQDGADGQDGGGGGGGGPGTARTARMGSPQLRINAETNQWEVSHDNGTTWDSLGVSATGPAGQDGQDGQDGQIPVIGSNGNWWIGTTDTGISCRQQQWHRRLQWHRQERGEDGADGADGLTPLSAATATGGSAAPTPVFRPRGRRPGRSRMARTDRMVRELPTSRSTTTVSSLSP